MKNYPSVSVVLNVYNESQNIDRCLSRIRNQTYPQNKIETILVDDKSTDDTLKKARKYKVKVFTSGYKNRERAKSIGLKKAKGKYLLLLDADVFLLGKNWIAKAVAFLEENKSVVAVQNIRWKYRRNDYIANRYCNLFGINDPVAMYLGKRGALMHTEKNWPNETTIVKKNREYIVAKFTPQNLPTMGAQGFMARRSLLLKTSWQPYFFHLDSIYELVESGFNYYILTELVIDHKYVKTIIEFYKKLYRNMELFLKLNRYRKYKYEVKTYKFFLALLLMISVLYPTIQALNGYRKHKDLAWFLHPLFCFTVPILYSFVFARWYLFNLIDHE